MAEPIVECVPNFSEGRDERIVRNIVRSMNVYGVSLLDWSMDAAHNRSVVTIAGAPEAVAEAAIRAVGRAAELIDLTQQIGVHPRIGAADVVPFVPVSNYSLGQCASLAHHAGLEIWRRFGVPVYFYEAAARDARTASGWKHVRQRPVRRPPRARPHRSDALPRRGLRATCTARRAPAPSARGSSSSPTTSTCRTGTSPATLHAARAVARALRESGGGHARASRRWACWSTAAPRSASTSPTFASTPVQSSACGGARSWRIGAGCDIAGGELIGLVPEEACPSGPNRAACGCVKYPGSAPEEKVLERRLEQPMSWPEALQ